MGKAAAIRLAEAGVNITLVDLNKETGQQLADELSKKHSGQKFIVRIDFTVVPLALTDLTQFLVHTAVQGCRCYRR